MPAYEPVRAILRGLEVLRAVSATGPVTASEIARAAGLPQPTTVRILETLAGAGYVARDAGGATFAVTARAKALGAGYDARSRLAQIAQPEIEALRNEIGWPSNLSVREGRSMVIIYTNRAANGLALPGRLGTVIPMLPTGTGRIVLAHLPPEERAALLDELRASADRWDSAPEFWADIDAELDQIRRRGYAFAQASYLEEVYGSLISAVAAPITVNGKVEAALSSLVLRTAGSVEDQLDRLLPALRACAGRIARALEQEGAA
ncbi:MAG: IclR family transcriptional regulator [Pikeienuella sp.]